MILISNEVMTAILKSRTLCKVYAQLLYAYYTTQREIPNLDGLFFSLDDLAKALGYANKSSVSRALKELANLGVIQTRRRERGIEVTFGNEKINTMVIYTK